MQIYIDYTNGINATENVTFHGGGDFGRMITHKIIDIIKEKSYNIKPIIIWPKGCLPKTEDEKEIFHSSNILILEAENLLSVVFEPDSTLLLPLIPNINLRILKDIKANNSSINICCVIHDVRILDVRKYDKYDRYYYTDYRRLPYVGWLRRYLAGELTKINIKKYLKYSDKIFTVSNNSLQEITKYHKPKYIKYIMRNSKTINLNTPTHFYKDKYTLFVSSNRYVKNFLRTLSAFCRYKKENDDDLYLYAVGVSKEFSKIILNNKIFDKEIVKKWVRFFDYVTEQELTDLYKQCSFLLYTSKGEGFGLPPLEAMEVGRPTVASYVSSIPEVLGFGAYYIDPYDELSIMKGIDYMSKEKNQNYYIEILEKLKPSLRLRGELDTRYLAEEILVDIVNKGGAK